jgi:uncharacterized membrane protein (DUF2068 family)
MGGEISAGALLVAPRACARRRASGEDAEMDAATDAGAAVRRKDRLLPWIAAERAFRAVVLAVVGIALVTHPHTDWSGETIRFAHKLGLNPNSNWIRKIVEKIRHIRGSQYLLFGIAALSYAALEGTEAYGLWRRRRWGEWLTVIATSLLLIPEGWELSKGTSPLKVGALIVNLLIVAYLLWRLRREGRPSERPRRE